MKFLNNFKNIKNIIKEYNLDIKDKNLSFLKEDKIFQVKIAKLVLIVVLLIIGTGFANNYLKQEIATANTKQNEYQEIQGFLKKHHENLTTYNQNLSQIKGKIISEEEIDQANAVIIKLAEKNNVKVNNVKKIEKKNISPSSNIFHQPTEIIAEGEYPNILKFVADIENVENFFTSVESFNILNQPAKDINSISVKISYKIFYEKKG